MPTFDFNCPQCGGPCIRAYKFCPWCAIEIQKPEAITRKVNGRRFEMEGVRKLLQPLIDLNGYVWVANKIGIDESAIRHPLSRQETISERVLDRWLTPLGLTNALFDGTLETTEKSDIPEPPKSQFFEE